MREKQVTIIDLANIAGVSKSTVSRVLSGRGYVSSDVREAVNRAIEQTGYRRNDLARSLRQGSSNIIGAIVPNMSNNFFAQIVLSVQLSARKLGWSLLIFNTVESLEEELAALENLLSLNVSGLLLITSAHEDYVYPRGKRIPVPTVFLDRPFYREDIFPRSVTVTTDDAAGGTLAAQKIQAAIREDRKVLVLKDSRRISNSEARYLAFRSCFADAQVLVSDIVFDVQKRTWGMGHLPAMCRKNSVGAIFCTSEPLAYEAIFTLKQSGFRIPDEVQILGFDGFDWADRTDPRLATVAQDTRKLGNIAVEQLALLTSGADGGTTEKIKPYYIQGGTLV